MKLSKLLAAVATIAIVSDITRRIVTEIEIRRMDAEIEELFGWETEEYDMANYNKPKVITVAQRKQAERQSLLAEQDYELRSLSHAITTQDEAEIARSKARLAEIHSELEAL